MIVLPIAQVQPPSQSVLVQSCCQPGSDCCGNAAQATPAVQLVNLPATMSASQAASACCDEDCCGGDCDCDCNCDCC